MSEADTSESSEPPGRAERDQLPAGDATAALALIDIADPQRRLTPAVRTWLEDAVARAIAAMGCGGEVRIRVVDDVEIAEAHLEYLGEPGTTDVITFDLSDPEDPLPVPLPSPSGTGEALTGMTPRRFDTDLLICIDEALRQAGPRGHTPEQELLLYIIHGLLHCLGHDDHDEEAAARMHRAEDRVLEAIGIGATYSRPPSGPPQGGVAGDAPPGKEQS
jgi:probable rRNA maturation factor